MLLNYLLCLIGIVGYFLYRFSNRTNKSAEISISFWWKDNWPELTQSLLFTLTLMILLNLKVVVIDLQFLKFLPEGTVTPLNSMAKPLISAILGWGGSAVIYSMFLKKSKDIEKKVTGQ